MNPENRSYSTIKVILFLLAILVILIGGLYFYYQYYLNAPKSQIPPNQTSQTSQRPTSNPINPNADKALANLYKLSNTPTDIEVLKQSNITRASLPRELDVLINPNSYEILTQKSQFSDGKSGFQINYKLESLIYLNSNFYAQMINNNPGWVLVSNYHNGLVGLLKMKNDKYDVLVESKVIDEKNIGVYIKIVQK